MLKPLTLEEVLALKQRGAQLLDVRDAADFARAHVVGSVNIGLGGQFATWAGTLLKREQPIVIVAEPGREEEAAMRLGRIGFDHVAGYLQGGVQALEPRPDLVGQINRVTAAALAEQLMSAEPPVVLDVRTEREWRSKRIAGALNLPLNHLLERLQEVPRDRQIVVQCASGYRSSTAASLLKQHGIADVVDLIGGINAWQALRIPTAAPVPA